MTCVAYCNMELNVNVLNLNLFMNIISARQFREAGRIAKEEKVVSSSLEDMKKDEQQLSTSLKEKLKALDAANAEMSLIRTDKLQLERKEGTFMMKQLCYTIHFFLMQIKYHLFYSVILGTQLQCVCVLRVCGIIC